MVLIERAYEIAKNHNYDGYQRKLKSIVYNFFDKKPGSGISVNEQVAKEVHKPVTKKIKRGKFYARFKNNIWSAGFAEMEKKNNNVKCLLCVIDVFTKYSWDKPLKDKKYKAVPNVFIKMVNKSNRKSNKI